MASVSFMYAECMLEVWMKYSKGMVVVPLINYRTTQKLAHYQNYPI